MSNKRLFFHEELRKYLDFLKELDNERYLTKEGKSKLNKFLMTRGTHTAGMLARWKLGGQRW